MIYNIGTLSIMDTRDFVSKPLSTVELSALAETKKESAEKISLVDSILATNEDAKAAHAEKFGLEVGVNVGYELDSGPRQVCAVEVGSFESMLRAVEAAQSIKYVTIDGVFERFPTRTEWYDLKDERGNRYLKVAGVTVNVFTEAEGIVASYDLW